MSRSTFGYACLRSLAIVLAFGSMKPGPVGAQPSPAASSATLRLVVVVSRHGVRSPTDPAELQGYAAKPWPAWEVAPGFLTPHGAALMTAFGRAYRWHYAAEGLLPATGCPAPDSTYVWADVDERTKATAAALLDGFAPGCGLAAHDLGATVDPLFHPIPSLGKGDPVTAAASAGSVTADGARAIVIADAAAFAKLDSILGCGRGTPSCTPLSSVPTVATISPKSGLASMSGAVDLASTAVEDFILAYADGKPLADVGWGAVDAKTLHELSRLHVLKFETTTETPYQAALQGSNLLAHLRATLDQAVTGTKNAATRVPESARFVALVGHDTNLGALAGLLRLRWLLDGYQWDDTPPGGALVFELYRGAAPGATPFVRTFFTAQSLDEMRTLANVPPHRVPVFVPGCPALDCPVASFDRIVDRAIDPAFVATW